MKFHRFIVDVTGCLVRQPFFWGNVVRDTYQVGIQSLLVCSVVAAFIGSTLAVQGASILRTFGSLDLISIFVSLAGLREMAPMTTAAMCAAKAGSGITATLATMRTKQQIDAMEVMGVNPLAYLVIPKIIAFCLVLPLLVILSDALCIIAGMLVCYVQFDVSPSTFADALRTYVGPRDLYIGMGKGVLFGLVICLMSTYFGFTAGIGPSAVGVATNRSVIWLCLICILVNSLITYVCYFAP